MNDLLWSFMHIAIYDKAAGLTAAKRLRPRRFSGTCFGVEQAFFDPPLGPVRFEALGFVNLLDFHGEVQF